MSTEMISLVRQPESLSAEVTGPDGVCKMCSISKPTLYRMRALGLFLPPIKIGLKKTVWRIAEIREWLAAGAPSAEEWEARKGTQGARRS